MVLVTFSEECSLWNLPPGLFASCIRGSGFRVLGGIRRERQLFILESSHLRTSMSDDSNLPEEAAVRDPGIQQPSALWLLQERT